MYVIKLLIHFFKFKLHLCNISVGQRTVQYMKIIGIDKSVAISQNLSNYLPIHSYTNVNV